MIKWQKIIKYGAIAFAFFLIFSILSSIALGIVASSDKAFIYSSNVINLFINKFSKSLNKELNNIGITFKNWYKEIINSYSKNTYGVVLTNAMAESNNNYIQTLINIGYGYTNFNRLRKRILYMSSNKNRNQYQL